VPGAHSASGPLAGPFREHELMSSPLLVSVSAMDTRLGRPAIPTVEEPGEVGEWARHHREALRAALCSCG